MSSKPLNVFGAGWRELTHRPPSQVPALDALRAAAVLLVIGSHYVTSWGHAGGADLALARSAIFNFGWTGVDLFFILSGLLIGKQLWRELDQTGTVRVPRFLLRRGFRIWPLYFATLASLLVLWPGSRLEWADWLFLSNYVPTAYGRSWSLSTEEQFYIAVPFILLFGARFLPPKAQAWPIIALILAVPLARWWQANQLRPLGLTTREFNDALHLPIHLHCEALLIGLLLALMSARHPHVFRTAGRWGLSKVGLGVFIAASALGIGLRVLDKTLFAFLALGLIFGSLTFFVLSDRSILTRPLGSMVFYPISRLAYGMYLNHFHFWTGSTAWTIATFSGVFHPLVVFAIGLVVGTGVSMLVATITFLLIEHPFLMLREHWLGERKAAGRGGPLQGAPRYDRVDLQTPESVVK